MTSSERRGRAQVAVLAAAFGVAVAWSTVRPVHFRDWVLEIAVPIAGFALLALTYRRFRFTTLSYALLFAEAMVLVVGAHYTHAKVPLFDWISARLELERNHYDRFAHFCVGLFVVIPVREVLMRASPLRRGGGWLPAMSAAAILAWAAFYEITEWWIAALAEPGMADAYLGAQGDPFDAQKDMLLDGLGAAAGLLLLTRAHDRRIAALSAPSPG